MNHVSDINFGLVCVQVLQKLSTHKKASAVVRMVLISEQNHLVRRKLQEEN